MDKYVNLLIERLIFENNKQIRNGVYGYTQRNLAYNSNKIEGSKLTKDQTNMLFETRSLSSDGDLIRAKDVEETTGHFIMFNTMLNTFDETLSEDIIKDYHFALKSGVFEDKTNGFPIGEYKNRANIVLDMKTASPDEVSELMKDLIENYNSKDIITLEDLSEFHANYEKIHPFQDGNGRTGRMILYKECLKNNIFPFIIEDDYKPEYYKCLKEAQINNNYDPINNFFKFEQERYYDNVINLIKDLEKDNSNTDNESDNEAESGHSR